MFNLFSTVITVHHPWPQPTYYPLFMKNYLLHLKPKQQVPLTLLAQCGIANIIYSLCQQSEARGGAVLSILHDRTVSLTGCGQLQDVMVFLTQAAAVPYMHTLAKWLYRGIITDPYDEVRYGT